MVRHIIQFLGNAIRYTLLCHQSDIVWILELDVLFQQVLVSAPVSLQEVQRQEIGDVDIEPFLTILEDERGHIQLKTSKKIDREFGCPLNAKANKNVMYEILQNKKIKFIPRMGNYEITKKSLLFFVYIIFYCLLNFVLFYIIKLFLKCFHVGDEIAIIHSSCDVVHLL